VNRLRKAVRSSAKKAVVRNSAKTTRNSNLDRKNALARKRRSVDPERHRAVARRYYRHHKKKICKQAAERRRKAYEANPKKYLARWRKAYFANREKRLLVSARNRAKEKGLPFNITATDIVVSKRCPVFGVLLKKGKGAPGPNSPTLDKILPLLGYVRGNIAVLSHRANRIKNDATYEELFRVARWVRERVSPRRWVPIGFRGVHFRPEGYTRRR
jgi:hypothetical protein